MPAEPSPDRRCDLAVIGSGPAGQKCAIAAAKLGKRVVIVDANQQLGGACLHTGTIPSKTLREAVLFLTGFRQHSFYGPDFRLQATIRSEDLQERVRQVVARQQAVISDQLQRNGIEVLSGSARFSAPHRLEVTTPEGPLQVEASYILVACGTRPARRDDIDFGDTAIQDTDEILQAASGAIARSVLVIGAGIIGLEYASMGAALGMRVRVVETRDKMLDFADDEIVLALHRHLAQLGVEFVFGEKVSSVRSEAGGVSARLASGRELRAERLLYAVGRQPNTDLLNLPAIGLETDERGRLRVDEHFRTPLPHVYAAGDVIGFPALASTSMEQGRLAACHMFGAPVQHAPELIPYGIYTIPEISMVGSSEGQLRERGVPYEVGRADFREIARAQITGDQTGLLKLVFQRETLQLLGMHIIADGAAELVHIGQAVLATRGSVEIFRDLVFNYPTAAEAYKVAALDGLNRLAGRASRG